MVTGPQSVKRVLKALQLFDAFSIRNRIVGESGAVGENLIRDLVRETVKVSWGLLGEKDLEGHARRTFLNNVVLPAPFAPIIHIPPASTTTLRSGDPSGQSTIGIDGTGLPATQTLLTC